MKNSQVKILKLAIREGIVDENGNLTKDGIDSLALIKREESLSIEDKTIGYIYGIDLEDEREIDLLEISVRLFRTLEARGIKTVNQLAQKTIGELRSLGVNPHGLRELQSEFSIKNY